MLNSITFILIFLSLTCHARPEDFFKGKTSIDDPFELRDPFKKPFSTDHEAPKVRQGYVKQDGKFSNVYGLSNRISFKQLEIVGVLIGKERRVIVRPKGAQGSQSSTGPTFVLKEGTEFPVDNSVLKAILPGGVILVEKITNVYGQDEYLETVIPITK